MTSPSLALRSACFAVVVCSGLLAFSSSATADHDSAKAEVFSRDGAAIGGYDAVAYFTESKPVKGSSEHSFEWRGATWQFSSAENLAAFSADPERYAPRYGGYCAYGVSQGYAVKTEPEAWSVVDGKLYLNYSLSVRRTWLKDTEGYIETANGNWPRVLVTR